MKKITILFSLIFMLLLPIHSMAAAVDEVRQYVKNYYVGETSGNIDQASSIEQLMSMLDPYSIYYSAEEYKQFVNSVNNQMIGIGVVILEHEKGISIASVLSGGSAESAGIEAGDIITAVDGTSVVGKTASYASSIILGKEGTNVTLTILKKSGSTITQTLTRKLFSIPNVTSELLYGNVGYISLATYSSTATTEVKEAIQTLKKQGATQFIFDLQNNGGGYVDIAEEIIGLFPNAFNAFKYTDKQTTAVIPAIQQSIQFPKNTKVLINGGSASASDMTAAALKEQNAATLYGTTSYGKGTMQTLYPLSDNSYLKLTVAQFFSPNGQPINKVGVTPNVQSYTPLATAHFDTLQQTFTNYKQMDPLNNVAPSKTFTVQFKKDVLTQSEQSIELVLLGGEKVDITTEIKGSIMHVTPKEPLLTNGQYALIIHPTIKTKNNIPLKQGTITFITVSK